MLNQADFNLLFVGWVQGPFSKTIFNPFSHVGSDSLRICRAEKLPKIKEQMKRDKCHYGSYSFLVFW